MNLDYNVESHLLTLRYASLLIDRTFWRHFNSVVHDLPLYVGYEVNPIMKFRLFKGRPPGVDRDIRVCHQPVFIAPPESLVELPVATNMSWRATLSITSPRSCQELDDAEIRGVIAIQFADAMIRQHEHLSWRELGGKLKGMDAEQLAKKWGFQTSSGLKATG